MGDKAELLREGMIFLIHLFARAILLMEKLKIKEIRPPSNQLLKLINQSGLSFLDFLPFY